MLLKISNFFIIICILKQVESLDKISINGEWFTTIILKFFLLNYFLQYWSVVASSLANRSSVLAYELINEPWAGDVFSNPVI